MTTIDTMAREWATRPPDHQVPDWDTAERKAFEEERVSKEYDVAVSADALFATHSQIWLGEEPLAHTGYLDVAQLASAPAGYVASLPTDLAVRCLQEGLGLSTHGRKVYSIGDSVRAITSQRYVRENVHNSVIVHFLRNMAESCGLQAAEKFRSSTRTGEGTHPLGYLGDGSLAFCLVNYDRPIEFGGRTLFLGVIVTNSTLGDAAAKCEFFAFDYVCANFLIWGAESLASFSFRHTGEVASRYRAALEGVSAALQLPESTTLDSLSSAVRLLGDTREAVQQSVYRMRNPLLGKKLIGQAYDRAATTGSYGDPRSAWAIVGGLTELSQETCTHVADRLALDRAAGTLLQAGV